MRLQLVSCPLYPIQSMAKGHVPFLATELENEVRKAEIEHVTLLTRYDQDDSTVPRVDDQPP
jgi:hypothetical protein